MALVVLGVFVLVWIISAVVKATQNTPPPNRGGANRPRPNNEPRPERTSDTDIDRFMAEIDRLRRRGEGHSAGRGQQKGPGSVADRAGRPEPRPRAIDRSRDRRPRPLSSKPAPPPLPAVQSVPVLRPIQQEATSPQAPPAPGAPPAAKLARAAKMAPLLAAVAKPSPVLESLQAVLKGKNGYATAVILAEILGEPPGKRAMMGGKRS
jgi:hypothetical protein